jgi:hypothetical protein
MLARWIFVLSIVMACPTLAGAEEPPLFPFVVSYDAPENVTNVSTWLRRPAGQGGLVQVREGRLVTKAGPIRFWATNLCFEACFPTHEEAERLAARLARLGINCVRMHHMDSHSIWGKSPNKLTIDPAQLERLDYLIYQLKQHGIYTDLNLHVSRWFDKAEGFVAREERPHYDKGLDNFEPRMIELQKKYAKDLLTHVNPYTQTAYTQEPAIACVEINNENALFAEWNGGSIDRLPEPYAATFRQLWNTWLREKYGSTEKLRQAWNVGRQALGEEMLRGGDFAQAPERNWNLERDDQTGVEWSTGAGGPEGQPRLRLVVTRPGRIAWHPQFSQARLTVKKEAPYTLTCWLRADAKRNISVNCMMAHDPWQNLGFHSSVDVGPQWKPCRFTFVAERDDTNARITFSSFEPGTYELAQVSLRPGGIVGLEAGQQLEDDGVPVLRHGSLNTTRQARADFVDFLWDTERDYWSGMYRYLKDELHVQPLVAGTQLSYSPAHVQAGLDFIDAHSYWHHPAFPGRPWDSNNWYVHNAALVNTPGGTLSGLAVRRVADMAYTVSEYNHPAPIVYAAEGFPMIAAFGAFQSWDAIYNFTYSHNTDFEPGKISGFFDIKGDTAKLVHMPACAAMFLRGDVAPAKETLRVPMAGQAERQKLHETLSAWRLTAEEFGLDSRWSLVHGTALDLRDTQAKVLPKLPEGAKEFVSDTGQLRWNLEQPGAGYFTVDTPRTKFFTGFVRGRTFQLGNVGLKIGPTRQDWATVSLVAMRGEGFDQSARILVAATGWQQNSGATLQNLDGDRVTLGNRWGNAPVLCEGVPAEITLPVAASRVHVYPLDEAGNRRGEVACKARDGKALVNLGPEYKTVWYEVEIE